MERFEILNKNNEKDIEAKKYQENADNIDDIQYFLDDINNDLVQYFLEV